MISQNSVEHPQMCQAWEKREMKVNITQPLFWRHSQFSNYLALFQVAFFPHFYIWTISPVDFAFKCLFNGSLPQPPQFSPLHLLLWLQCKLLAGFLTSTPPSLLSYWLSCCQNVPYHTDLTMAFSWEHSTMGALSKKAYRKRPVYAMQSHFEQASSHSTILHFILEKNWTIDSFLVLPMSIKYVIYFLFPVTRTIPLPLFCLKTVTFFEGRKDIYVI